MLGQWLRCVQATEMCKDLLKTHNCGRVADHRRDLRFLHLRVDPVLLPEDPPGHARSRHQEHHRQHFVQHVSVDTGQDTDERPRGFLLHRVRLQRLVHPRVLHPVHRVPQQVGIHQGVRQHHRLCRYSQLLHRSGASEVRFPPGKRRHPRVLLHHPHHAAVQTHPPLIGAQDSDSDVPRIRQRAHPARLLPGAGHRHLRQPGVLRGAHPSQPSQRFQQHPPRPVVGTGHNDHRGIRGHGPQDVCRDVCWRALRPGRRADHRPAGTGHRVQLRHVLLPHAGAGEAAQEEAESAASGTASGTEASWGPWSGGSSGMWTSGAWGWHACWMWPSRRAEQAHERHQTEPSKRYDGSEDG